MKGSLKIARLFSIPVFVHWSFPLIFLYIFYTSYRDNHDWQFMLLMCLYVISIFICVIMHEFGHVLSARYFGINTQDVMIYPIGGVARLNGIPEKPMQEFTVAIAGPMVNFLICLFLILVLVLGFGAQLTPYDIVSRRDPYDLLFENNPTAQFILLMMRANFWLIIFNMIPAFPMDGGRVLRSLLCLKFNRTKATFIASLLGQIFAGVFLIYALLPLLRDIIPPDTRLGLWLSDPEWEFQPVLAFISYFIFNAARSEYQYVRANEILNEHTVSRFIKNNFTRLNILDLMQRPINIAQKGEESNFLVFDDAEILRGVLKDDDIAIAHKNNEYEAVVLTYMTKDFIEISPEQNIKKAYQLMVTTPQYILPVINDGVFLGIVDIEQIHQLLSSETN